MSKSTRHYLQKQALSPAKLSELLVNGQDEKSRAVQKQLEEARTTNLLRQQEVDGIAQKYNCSAYAAAVIFDCPWLSPVVSAINNNQTRVVQINPFRAVSPSCACDFPRDEQVIEIIIAPTHCPSKAKAQRAALLLTDKGNFAFWPIKPDISESSRDGKAVPTQHFFDVERFARIAAAGIKKPATPHDSACRNNVPRKSRAAAAAKVIG